MEESQNRKGLQRSENSKKSGTDRQTDADEFRTFFDDLWARLCAAFPRTEVTIATTALYYERLQRFKPEQLRRAADILIDNCEYFPTVAEVISTIQRLPTPKPPILLEERPDPEVVKKARQLLTDLIEEKSIPRTADDEGARRKLIREQAALLRRQEATINGKEKAS